MTDHDAALAARLEDAFPAPAAEHDWGAVRREARRARIRTAAAITLALATVFAVLPALGVGRDVLWLDSEDDTSWGYTVAEVATEDGRVEFRATRGIEMGLSVWLDGEFRAGSRAPDDGLHGRATEGPRYLGLFAGSFDRNIQFAFSPIAHEVAAVEVVLADGSTRAAAIAPPPQSVHTDLRFYYVVLPLRPRIAAVRALDAGGAVLEQHRCCGAGFARERYRVSP